MSNDRVTTAVLAEKIDSLTKATETRDQSHETILSEIKLHVGEIKEQVYKTNGRVTLLEHWKNDADTMIKRNIESVQSLSDWKTYILGGVAVVGALVTIIGIVTPIIVGGILESNNLKMEKKINEVLTEITS